MAKYTDTSRLTSTTGGKLYAGQLSPTLKKHFEGVLLERLTAPSPFGQSEFKPRPWWQRLYYRYIMPIVWFARYVKAYWRDGN